MKYGFLAAFVIVFMFACSNNETAENSSDPQEKQQQTAVRETIAVKAVERIAYVSGVGIVGAERETEISPEITGKVLRLFCETGQSVNKGEVLVELDSESRRIALKRKKALLTKAEVKRKKIKRDKKKVDSLYGGGIISNSEYDGAELDTLISDADMELAGADVMSAEKELRDTRITAPFSGKIARRTVEIGNFVNPGQKLMTLIDMSSVKVIVEVSERDIAGIDVANIVTVSIDSLPGPQFDGKVKTIALKADEATRTFPVEIILPNPANIILPGMVARVSIKTSFPEKRLLIPNRAVWIDGRKTVVSILSGNETIKREVSLGRLSGDEVMVNDGLSEGDVLVITASDLSLM
ncbi:MAG: efflux RND transporter periplasmic adaptor subunit [Deltaproteobacteria bacterium]|nr:efflux RND transporter periplasmic adaptor subunit [Deltaproteobacteria bacterium]